MRSGTMACVVLLTLLTCIGVAPAAPVKVLVFPFEVHAPQNLDYLQTQIATVLAGHLQRDGVTIIELLT